MAGTVKEEQLYLEWTSKQQVKQAKIRVGEERKFLKIQSILFKTFCRALLTKKSAIVVSLEGLQDEPLPTVQSGRS